MPDGTKYSINSSWDAKQFYAKYDIQREKIDNIKTNGIEVMIEGKLGRNGTKTKHIDFNGNSATVYLGVHDVAAWQYHTSVVVFVTADSEFYNNSNYKFQPVKGQFGVQYTTIGAGPQSGLSSGVLKAGYARPNDANLGIKNTLKNLYVSDDRIIGELFANTKYYIDTSEADNDYYLWPGFFGGEGHHNSNSFAHGLLDATGISVSKPNYHLPGWDDPVPKSMFGK